MSLAAAKFQPFVQNLGRGSFNLHTDTIKIALSNTAPAGTEAQLSQITQIATANGYSAGGNACTGVSYSQTSGTATLAATGPTFTASGGSMGAFRYLVAYSDTSTNDLLICYWDRGSSLTLDDTSTYTPSLASGILTVV